MAEGIFHQNDKDFIDLIFSSGNGVCEVDPEWFNHAVAGTVFQTPGIPIAQSSEGKSKKRIDL